MPSTIDKQDLRAWAWEHFHGVNNVVIPSFSQDLTRLNEKGIRHDVRKVIDLGFTGTLLVGELSISLEEYVHFTEIAQDEANGALNLIFHASFNTLEENIEAARRAHAAGSWPCCRTRLASIPRACRTSSTTPRPSATPRTLR